MLRGKKVSKILLVVVLCISLVLPVGATDIKDSEQKKDALEQELEQAEQKVVMLTKGIDGSPVEQTLEEEA